MVGDDELVILSYLVKFKKWVRRIVDVEGLEIEDLVGLVRRVEVISV